MIENVAHYKSCISLPPRPLCPHIVTKIPIRQQPLGQKQLVRLKGSEFRSIPTVCPRYIIHLGVNSKMFSPLIP